MGMNLFGSPGSPPPPPPPPPAPPTMASSTVKDAAAAARAAAAQAGGSGFSDTLGPAGIKGSQTLTSTSGKSLLGQ